MRFGLLGPVEVLHDGRPLAIGRGHEKIVLAILLLNANRLTSTSRLIDALWAESPPSAKGQLHNLISRLRGRFRTAGDEIIVSHPGGYELRLGEHDFDVFEFRRLLERGRAALADGHHELAFVTLTDSLALWRGDALADVSDEFAAQLRQALHDERLAATEARLEAGLSLARHDEVLRELTDLLAEHPHRERLQELRMTALVATGRRAEALTAYREVYRSFVDALGVEPGSTLRELEQRALQGEPVSAPTPSYPVPRQLPPTTAVLVGRDELVDATVTELTNREQAVGRIAILTGPGGVGKSAVALAAAHAVLDAFPDGQLYVNLRGAHGNPARSHDVAARLLRGLGVPGADLPDDPDERIAALRNRLVDRRLLMVLDDAASEEQVRPLLPGGVSCGTVITSRRQLAALVGVARFEVPMLSPDAAVRLLSQVIGASRVAGEPTVAAAIAELCGYLPLAVCVAAARLSVRPEWSLADLRSQLSEQRSRLDALAVGDLNVRASIALSHESLEPRTRRLFRRLGLLRLPDWPVWVARELVGAETDGPVVRMLDELVDAHLVESLGRDQVGQQRYRLHDLIADFGAERIEAEETAEERADALARTMRGWLARATEADEHLGHAMAAATGLVAQIVRTDGTPAVRDAPAGWFEVERVNLTTVTEQACAQGSAELAGNLALRMVGFLTMRSYEDDLEQTLDAVIDSVRAHGLDQLLFRLLNGSFAMRAQRNQFAQLPAITEEELALARRLGDPRNEVLALSHTGRAARMLGQFVESADWLEQALAVSRRHEVDPNLVTRVLAALAVLQTELGRPDRAVVHSDEAVRLDRSSAAPRNRAIHLRVHGIALMEAGRFGAAHEALREALSAVEALGDDRGAAWVEHALADLDLRAQRWTAAQFRLDRSLVTHERFGDQEGIAMVWRSRGDLAASRGRLRDAVGPWLRELKIWSTLDVQLERARAHARLDLVLTALGEDLPAQVHRGQWRRILAQLRLGEPGLRLPPLVIEGVSVNG